MLKNPKIMVQSNYNLSEFMAQNRLYSEHFSVKFVLAK